MTEYPHTGPCVPAASGGMPVRPAADEVLARLIRPALFRRPVAPEARPLTYHLPLLFWLVDVLRPGLAVDIGGDSPLANRSLTEAASLAGLATTCVSFREQAPMAARRRIEAGSVDLLLMEGSAGPGTTAALLEGWGTRLSDRAIVLVHGQAVPAAWLQPGRSAVFAAGEGMTMLAVGAAIRRQSPTYWTGSPCRSWRGHSRRCSLVWVPPASMRPSASG